MPIREPIDAPIRERITQAREAAGVSKTELARRVGVTKGAAGNWEAKDGSSPSVENLSKIAVALDVHFEWLATGRGPMRYTPPHPAVCAEEAAPYSPDMARLIKLASNSSEEKRKAIITLLSDE